MEPNGSIGIYKWYILPHAAEEVAKFYICNMHRQDIIVSGNGVLLGKQKFYPI